MNDNIKRILFCVLVAGILAGCDGTSVIEGRVSEKESTDQWMSAIPADKGGLIPYATLLAIRWRVTLQVCDEMGSCVSDTHDVCEDAYNAVQIGDWINIRNLIDAMCR